MVDDGRGGRLPHKPVRYRIVAEKRDTGERVEGVVDWDGLSDLWAVETEGGSTRFVSVLDSVIEWEPVGFGPPASNGQGGSMQEETATGAGPRFPNITVQLVGQDGNVFNVIGLVSVAMRRAGLPSETVSEFVKDVTSQRSYDGALATVCKWVDVE